MRFQSKLGEKSKAEFAAAYVCIDEKEQQARKRSNARAKGAEEMNVAGNARASDAKLRRGHSSRRPARQKGVVEHGLSLE